MFCPSDFNQRADFADAALAGRGISAQRTHGSLRAGAAEEAGEALPLGPPLGEWPDKKNLGHMGN